MPKTALTVASLIWMVCSCPGVRGQDSRGNPLIEVTLRHAPSLGTQAKRVAFGPSQGNCSDQLIDMVIADFVQHQVEVIDRLNLEKTLAEHRFTLSGSVDRTTAAELGKILGPAALIFIKVTRCVTEKKALVRNQETYSRQQPVVRVYVSKTEGFFSGSIQVVDLATARVLRAHTLNANPSRQSESTEGQPEFPSEHELQDLALREAAGSIRRMFFPWTERAKLLFYDDKDCNLKKAHQMFQAGDYEGSLRLSEENLEKCKSTPKVQDKTLGHANYNVGIGHYVRGGYDKALEYLTEASRLRPGDFVTRAMNLCREAKAEAERMQKEEERVAVGREDKRALEAAANQPKLLTVSEVATMLQAGWSEELIAARIRRDGRAYDLGLQEMLDLKKAGASENLIKFMLDPSTLWTPTRPQIQMAEPPATKPVPVPAAGVPARTQAPSPPAEPPAKKPVPKAK